MPNWNEFTEGRTRGELQTPHDPVRATSAGLGWSSAYVSFQREQPFEAELSEVIDCLLVLHRSGPVDVTLRVGSDKPLTQQRHRGQISFIPGGCVGGLKLHGPHDTLHVYLRAELFAGKTLAPLLGVVDPLLEGLGTAIGEAVHDRQPQSALYADPIAQAIADRILQVCEKTRMLVKATRLSERQLHRMREFVETNLESDIGLSHLARACGVSTKTLQRGFKEATGMSPYQYVLARRVEKAKALLADKSLSLSEVAVRCGFCHLEHLTRVFQKFTGKPPGLYRLGTV